MLRNKASFYGELSAPRPTPKLEDHTLSAVRDCLFHIFVATLHIGGCYSVRNLKSCHAVVTGTHLSRFATPLNALNPKLNPICHLLALLGAHHILYVSRIRVKR